MQQNPYVFVVGCPRSGTTLLQRILTHHPLLEVVNDSHFIPRALKGERDELDHTMPLTAELAERAITYHRFHRLGIDEAVARSLIHQASTYSQFVGLLYGQVAQQAGKPFAGEKTPDYVRSLPLLHRLFPDARILHIIRDGREVALSLRDWATPTKGPGKIAMWDDNRLAVAAMWWEWQVRAALEARATLAPSTYHEIRYDDLVTDTDAAMRTATTFLGLPFEQAMLDYHVGRQRPKEGRSAKGAWLPPTSGLRDWRTQYTDDELALVELLIGDVLAELGFELAGAQPSDEIREQAAALRSRWQQEPSLR
jgi:hypothetical protein